MTDIFFEELSTVVTEGTGQAPTFVLNSVGYGADVGEGVGQALFRLSSSGLGYLATDGDLAPPVPAEGMTPLALATLGEGFLYIGGEGTTGLLLGSQGYAGAPGKGAGATPLVLDTFGWSPPADDYPYFFLVEQEPQLFSAGGAWFENVDESVTFAEVIDPTLVLLIEAMLRLDALPQPFATFVTTVESSLVMRDAVTLVFERELLAEVNLIDDVGFNFRLIVAVVDQLMLEDENLTLLNALVSVLVALELRDTVVPVWQAEVPEDLVLTEEQTFRLDAVLQILEDLVLAETIEQIAIMFAVVDDTFELADDWETNLAMIAEIMDSVDFGIRVRIGDDIYAGYVVNIRNAAVSEYENFPFNSMALIAGKPFGATADGIYLLQGPDDAGDPISAYVRTGALNMGSLTKVPNGWIGLKADGEMVMKTITMDKGFKKENHYRMKARPQGSPVESRFDIAKGLTSTYWQWELENVDGAYFELDFVKVWPIRMTRRYSGR